MPEEISQELRLLWLIEQVRQRRLGYGKVAELAGVPKALFIKMMGERRISPFDYDRSELEEEFRAAAERADGAPAGR
jgi:predicted HTH domain antitoxin